MRRGWEIRTPVRGVEGNGFTRVDISIESVNAGGLIRV